MIIEKLSRRSGILSRREILFGYCFLVIGYLLVSPSKTLLCLNIAFISGISLASIVFIPQIILWGILFAGVFAIFASLFFVRVNQLNFGIIGFCALLFIAGIARFHVSEFAATNNPLKDFVGEKVSLIGRIASEPDMRDNSQRLKIKIETGKEKAVVLITARRYPEYKYADEVKITGFMKEPESFSEFDYKKYLMKDGIYAVMDFPEMELVSENRNYNVLQFAYGKILLFKEKLKKSINNNFSPPHSFLLSGIILGDDKNMDAELKDKMSATGLSHLTAISGSNVVILTIILTAFLLSLGMWRSQAFYFSVVFAWLYVLIAGLPASGVRAAIMAMIFLLAEKLGRQKATGRTIILAGALMLLQNPFLLSYDIGFQLSFLASLGIIYLKPLIDDLFIFISEISEKIKQNRKESRYRKLQRFTIYGIKENGSKRLKNDFFERVKELRDIFSVTIAAQIFTLPVIAYNFKQLSLVAPVTNLLIIPIIDWIMILGFMAVAVGFPPAGGFGLLGMILSLPCWFLLDYFLRVVEFFGKPWAVKNITGFSPVWIFLYFAVLSIIIVFLQKRKNQKFLGY